MENAQPTEDQPADNKPDEKPDDQESQSADVQQSPAAETPGEVFFNKNISILNKHPLPELDKGPMKVYKAAGKEKYASDLFVILCDKSMSPRRTMDIKYTKIVNANLVKMVASGRVLWPDTKEEYFCFVYEKPLGQLAISKDTKSPCLGLKPEEVMETVAYPMINVLMDLRDKEIIHGEIWPGNMFYTGTGEKVVLGECLSCPVASQLPTLYEPIERALASPLGRGEGTFADDMYAFGVSLAVMLRTSDPMEGLSEEQMIERKIEKGSYTSLISDRLSGATLELLRGLLYDDAEQRWTLDDVQAWMDGRRLSPKQFPKRIKANRPIVLNNKKYIRPELLAKDMHLNVDEAAKLYENGELDQWIDRAIEDKAIKIRMEQVKKDIASYDRSGGFNHNLCCAISTTLYTDCPIRFKGLSFAPEGFGKMLSAAYMQKKDIQPYAEVMRQPFILNSIRNRKNIDTSGLIGKFDSCRAFVTQTAIHSGIERCIYFLDPECPCLSPILEKYYIYTPEEMMDALESVCASNKKPDVLFDRHIVSFLSVKDRKNIDPYMNDLTSSSPHKRTLAQLRILATIQKRGRLGKFPALAGWMSKNLKEVYDRFHDKKTQEDLGKTIQKMAKEGDLTKVALLFEDPRLYQNDMYAFYQAMEEYRRIEKEKQTIEKKLNAKRIYGLRTGRQIASVISMGLAVVIIMVTAYMNLAG